MTVNNVSSITHSDTPEADKNSYVETNSTQAKTYAAAATVLSEIPIPDTFCGDLLSPTEIQELYNGIPTIWDTGGVPITLDTKGLDLIQKQASIDLRTRKFVRTRTASSLSTLPTWMEDHIDMPKPYQEKPDSGRGSSCAASTPPSTSPSRPLRKSIFRSKSTQNLALFFPQTIRNFDVRKSSLETASSTKEDKGLADALALSSRGNSPSGRISRDSLSSGSESPERIRSSPTRSHSSMSLGELQPLSPDSTSFNSGRSVTAAPANPDGKAAQLSGGQFFPPDTLFTRCLTGDLSPEQIKSLSLDKDAFISTTADYKQQGIPIILPRKGEAFTRNNSSKLIKTLSLNSAYEKEVEKSGVWFLTMGLGAKIAIATDRKSEAYKKFQEVDESVQCGRTASTNSREFVAAEPNNFIQEVNAGHINIYKIDLSGKTEQWKFAGPYLKPLREIEAMSLSDRTKLAKLAPKIDW